MAINHIDNQSVVCYIAGAEVHTGSSLVDEALAISYSINQPVSMDCVNLSNSHQNIERASSFARGEGSSVKTCKACGQTKELSGFYKNKNRKDGVSSQCKECIKARVSAFRNSEKGQKYYSEYRKSEAFKNAVQRYRQSEKGQAKAIEARRSRDPELTKKSRRRYRATEKGREQVRKYNHSEAARAANKRYYEDEQHRQERKGRCNIYNHSEAGRIAQSKRRQKPEHKEYMQQYRNSPKGQTIVFQDFNKRRSPVPIICDLTFEEWEQLKADYGYACAYCEKPTQKLEMEHFIPVSKGGHHTKENVVPSCRSCNAKKKDNLALTARQIRALIDALFSALPINVPNKLMTDGGRNDR